ncbi:MAG: stage III sporulation protein AF [Lachnospiraceae bacterium]|nr:stage III sporulation protein AF [Lachnospiraceae bacterium]
MLQNIREIGLFMILAQAVVHFAPGKQYGKYIKSISSVIILLLFLKPFVQLAGGEWQTASDILKRVEEDVKLPDSSALKPESSVEDTVKRRMEGEIETLLNRELAEDSCLVRRVELNLEEGAGLSGEEPFFTVDVVIGDRKVQDGESTVKKISIDVGQERDEEAPEAYRQRFAEILKMEKERVEVRWDGRD